MQQQKYTPNWVDDGVVDWEAVEESKKIVKNHLKGLNRVFGTGKDFGESAQSRAWKAKELESTTIPNVTVLPKIINQ